MISGDHDGRLAALAGHLPDAPGGFKRDAAIDRAGKFKRWAVQPGEDRLHHGSLALLVGHADARLETLSTLLRARNQTRIW
jgi:hypothetical protein